MIVSLIFWVYMTFVVMISGWMFCRLINRVTGYECHDFGVIWLLGLVMVTVYAQYFSLFSKVGALANVVLVLFCILVLGVERKKVWAEGKFFFGKLQTVFSTKKMIIFLLNFFMVLLLFLCVASQKAHHADTDLYHAQAVRWIEEYGVVKGLGNLHNRLAYNSSFMCLQALFSGKFLIDQSTHVVNGYIAFVICSYVLYLLYSQKKVCCSMLFQISILIYIFDRTTLSLLSSPNTDTLSLLLVLFILTKWCEYLENHEKNIVPYCLLCVIGLFSISVKLSTAMIMILLMKPAVQLIKGKKYKEIAFFIGIGLAVIAPFLIRNVIISGYLVYPYSSIDLFRVDWKMAKSVVDYDHKEIMAYARELCDYNLSDYGLTKWFPIWWNNQSNYIKILLGANAILFCSYMGCLLADIRKKQINWDNILLFLTVSALLLFWFVTAPNVRYGKVFVYGIPCVVLGNLIKIQKNKLVLCLKWFAYAGSIVMLIISVAEYRDEIALKRPAYYIYRECEETSWEGISMYVAIENCYCGYYYLPALPYKRTLDFIELRGDTIEDGFRVREEVKKLIFNNSGVIYKTV